MIHLQAFFKPVWRWTQDLPRPLCDVGEHCYAGGVGVARSESAPGGEVQAGGSGPAGRRRDASTFVLSRLSRAIPGRAVRAHRLAPGWLDGALRGGANLLDGRRRSPLAQRGDPDPQCFRSRWAARLRIFRYEIGEGS